MIRKEDLEKLEEVYNRPYEVTINDVPIEEKRCSIEIVPLNGIVDSTGDNIKDMVNRLSYDIICDDLEYLYECLNELWDKESTNNLKSYILNQIENKKIDPNGKMGLKLIMW